MVARGLFKDTIKYMHVDKSGDGGGLCFMLKCIFVQPQQHVNLLTAACLCMY